MFHAHDSYSLFIVNNIDLKLLCIISLLLIAWSILKCTFYYDDAHDEIARFSNFSRYPSLVKSHSSACFHYLFNFDCLQKIHKLAVFPYEEFNFFHAYLQPQNALLNSISSYKISPNFYFRHNTLDISGAAVATGTFLPCKQAINFHGT